jgi:hypothetical protein
VGRGRVDPAPSAPINSDPKGGRKKREEEVVENGEGNREREKPTVLREKQPKQYKPKTGDIDRETERDRRGEGRERTEEVNRRGKKTPTGVSTQRRRSAAAVTRLWSYLK